MSADMVKVVYIAGCGRSGSTLLDRILGEAPGFVPGGELRNVWSWGVTPTARCGCGVGFQECSFWRAVYDEAYGGFDQLHNPELFPHGWPALRRSIAAKLVLPWKTRDFQRLLEAHTASLERLYRAIVT